MAGLHDEINNLIGLSPEYVLIILGIILFFLHYVFEQKSLLTTIIISSFVLAVYDVVIKKILFFSVKNEYYKLIINNVVTIIIIDFLTLLIKDFSHPNLNMIFYFNLAFACVFYETIIFKLYNYNGLGNNKLRSITKTILRLSTIHILSNFLNGKEYDKEWFDFSIGQIFNFALFNIAFTD